MLLALEALDASLQSGDRCPELFRGAPLDLQGGGTAGVGVGDRGCDSFRTCRHARAAAACASAVASRDNSRIRPGSAAVRDWSASADSSSTRRVSMLPRRMSSCCCAESRSPAPAGTSGACATFAVFIVSFIGRVPING